MNGKILQGKVINTGEFKYSESPAWGWQGGVVVGDGNVKAVGWESRNM
jgi:hypothetical protein